MTPMLRRMPTPRPAVGLLPGREAHDIGLTRLSVQGAGQRQALRKLDRDLLDLTPAIA